MRALPPRAELEEETGYRAGRLEVLGEILFLAGHGVRMLHPAARPRSGKGRRWRRHRRRGISSSTGLPCTILFRASWPNGGARATRVDVRDRDAFDTGIFGRGLKYGRTGSGQARIW